MMQREEALKFLIERIELLKKKYHVRELMESGRVNQLTQVVSNFGFTYLDDYVHLNNLNLKISEIPENSCVELAFYISKTNYEDWEIFDNRSEFRELLKKEGGKVGVNINEKMYVRKENLSELTTEDFIVIF